MSMQLRLWMSAMVLVITSGAAVAQTAVIAVTPDQVKWVSDPNLPDGWKVSGLMGDSSKAGSGGAGASPG
jgi:hypothetical protein